MNSIYSQILSRDEAGRTSGRKELIIDGTSFLDECGRFRTVEFGRAGFVRA